MTITASADGSALGNPGPMGWAWYVDDECWAAGGSKHGTNNIGELTAVLELLRATAEAGRGGEDLEILCDSQYVINSVTKWMAGWKRKGWRKADGSPVLNVDLMKALDAAMQGRSVRFTWVKGHAGHAMNEAADARARAAATAFQRGTAPKEGPGFGGTATRAEAPSAPARPEASSAPARREAPASPVHPAELDLFGMGGADGADGEGDSVGTGAADGSGTDHCTTQVSAEQAEGGLLAQAAAPGASQLEALLAPDALLIDARGRELAAGDWVKTWASLMAGQASADMSHVRTRTVSPGAHLLTYEVESSAGALAVTALWVGSGSDLLLAHHRWSLA